MGKKSRRIIAILLVFLFWTSGISILETSSFLPVLFRLDEGVRPGETLTLYGEYLTGTLEVKFVEKNGKLAATTTPVQIDEKGHFCRILFPNITAGVYAVYVRNKSGWSKRPLYVNRAYPRWISEDRAYAGMKLKLFGRNLDASEYGGKSSTAVRFVSLDSKNQYIAKVLSANPYCLEITVPSNIKKGNYYVDVKTSSAGFGQDWVRLDNSSEFPEQVTPTKISIENRPSDSTALALGVAWANDFKWKNVFNVKTQFGAKGDGRTDDTKSIQDAVNAAAAAGGGVVYLPKGTYLSSTIIMDKGVVVKGEGRDVSEVIFINKGKKGAFLFTKMAEGKMGLQGVCSLRVSMHPENDYKYPISLIKFGDITDSNATRYFIYDTVLDTGKAKKEFGLSGRKWKPFLISAADQVLVKNNWMYSNTPYFNPYIGRRYTATGNTFEFDDGYIGVSGDQFLFEGNTIIGHHIEGYSGEIHGIFMGINGKRIWNGYIANNNIRDITGGNYGDGESIAFDGGEFAFAGSVLKSERNTAVVEAEVKGFDISAKKTAYIVNGTGMGQYRRVCSIEKAGKSTQGKDLFKITVSPAWDVNPDKTSKVTVAGFHTGAVSYANRAINVDNFHMLYQACLDHVIDRFISVNSKGVYVTGSSGGSQVWPVAYYKIKNCKLTGKNPETETCHFVEQMADGFANADGTGYFGTLLYGGEFRNNTIDRKGFGDAFGHSINFAAGFVQIQAGATGWGMYPPDQNYQPLLGTLYEGNKVYNSDIGIAAGFSNQTYIRNMTFVNCKNTLVDLGVKTLNMDAKMPSVSEPKKIKLPDNPISNKGWTASASSFFEAWDMKAKNAIDGDPKTIWAANEAPQPGQWFIVNMGKNEVFDSIVLDSREWGIGYTRGYEIFVSDDGLHWDRKVASGSLPMASSLAVIRFPVQKAQYIKLVQTGSVKGNKGLVLWGLAEFSVFYDGKK